LYGVSITFEYAYAKDYQVQTWNGTGWADQINIKNNSLLHRDHAFSNPVTTDRLRILVTSAPAFDMVSIYEVETYSLDSMTSATIFVPKSGQYTIAARLASQNEPDSFFMKVDDELFSTSNHGRQTELSWHQLGTAFLDVGEHTIGIAASGDMALDKIGLYSGTNNTIAIEDLFNSAPPGSPVDYEKINPCKYVAHMNCSKPTMLVFSDSYHPMWTAYLNDRETAPILTNMLVNGFFINKTGSFDITLYFLGQRYADISLVISGGATIAVTAVISVRYILVTRRRYATILSDSPS